jgi:hypothetical protein
LSAQHQLSPAGARIFPLRLKQLINYESLFRDTMSHKIVPLKPNLTRRFDNLQREIHAMEEGETGSQNLVTHCHKIQSFFDSVQADTSVNPDSGDNGVRLFLFGAL